MKPVDSPQFVPPTPAEGPQVFSLASYLPYHLTGGARVINRAVGSLMESRFGLKTEHWRMMSALATHGPVSTRELSALLSAERSTVSRTTSDLVKRGYIVRALHPADRRLLMLHFSANGKQLYKRMGAAAMEFQAALLAQISPQELATLGQVLVKLRTAALEYQSEKLAAGAPRRRGRRGARRREVNAK